MHQARPTDIRVIMGDRRVSGLGHKRGLARFTTEGLARKITGRTLP